MSIEVPVSEGDKAKEDIMLMMQRMMNHPEKRSRYESEDSSSKDEYVMI